MAIYYVDSNSLQDDSDATWNSSTLAYLDFASALAGSAGAGDTIWAAHNHAETDTTDTALYFTSPMTVVSVNSGTNQYEPGAKGTWTAGSAPTLDTDNLGFVNLHGVSFISNDHFEMFQGQNSSWYMCDGKLEITSTANSDFMLMGQSECFFHLVNMELAFGQIDQGIKFGSPGRGVFDGITVLSTIDNLFRGAATANDITLVNSDLISVTDAIVDPGSAASGQFNVRVKRCKIANGTDLFDTNDSFYRAQEIDAWSISDGGNHDTYSHMRYTHYEGEILKTDVVKRTSGATYDSTGFSLEFQTNANVVEFTQPLEAPIGAPVLDLSAGVVNLRLHIHLQDSAGTPVSLTDKNCRFKAVYPDSTDLALGKTVYSNPTITIVTSATDLPTEAATFTGTGVSGTVKQHYLDLTIPQNASMSAAVCELWLELSKDLAATTEMFVCPKPTVS